MNRPTKHFLYAAAMLLGLAGPAWAHEVWLERDGVGPARIYLQEIAPAKEEADETHRLKTSIVFTADPARPAPLAQRDKHFEATVSGAGDVWLHNDDVFAPWVDGGVKNGQVYHARAGRSETRAKLDFELVPVKSGGSDFTLLLRGKPVANSAVTIFSPKRVAKATTTDASGRIRVTDAEPGRYILVASTSEDAKRRMTGEDVARVHHMTTLSYVAE